MEAKPMKTPINVSFALAKYRGPDGCVLYVQYTNSKLRPSKVYPYMLISTTGRQLDKQMQTLCFVDTV
jgi:hypothetical protein